MLYKSSAIKENNEDSFYALLEGFDIRPKNLSVKKEELIIKWEDQPINFTYPSCQSNKCNKKCIDCFIPFCQEKERI